MARGPRRSFGTARAALRRLAPCLALVLALASAACVDEAQERDIGAAMAAEVNHQIPLVQDPLLNAYVGRLGGLLATASERPGLDYEFRVVDSRVVNAFALPGGYIYVTRGLLEQTRSGPELAAILAHEIGHVAARHGVHKLQRQLRTGSLVGVLYQLILGGEPELLRQRALGMAGAIWSARHSREDEQEADELAVRYLVRAGVNPEGMVTLLETLLAEETGEDSTRVADWFSTHPLTSSRISRAQAEIESVEREAPPGGRLELSSYPAFLRRLQSLPPPPDGP